MEEVTVSCLRVPLMMVLQRTSRTGLALLGIDCYCGRNSQTTRSPGMAVVVEREVLILHWSCPSRRSSLPEALWISKDLSTVSSAIFKRAYAAHAPDRGGVFFLFSLTAGSAFELSSAALAGSPGGEKRQRVL